MTPKVVQSTDGSTTVGGIVWAGVQVTLRNGKRFRGRRSRSRIGKGLSGCSGRQACGNRS